MVRLLSTEPLVGLAPPSLLGPGSRHCYGINYARNSGRKVAHSIFKTAPELARTFPFGARARRYVRIAMAPDTVRQTQGAAIVEVAIDERDGGFQRRCSRICGSIVTHTGRVLRRTCNDDDRQGLESRGSGAPECDTARSLVDRRHGNGCDCELVVGKPTLT